MPRRSIAAPVPEVAVEAAQVVVVVAVVVVLLHDVIVAGQTGPLYMAAATFG